MNVAELRVGDRILVRPGEQVPADGAVTEGASSMNEAFLAGEPRPVPKAVGDEVVAGAVNGEGALIAEVTRTGDETTLSQIRRLVTDAQASRGRYQALADRAAGWLTYIAVAAGAATVGEIVAVVYREVDSSLHPLAARSVRAHIEKLAEDGEVRMAGERIELLAGDRK